MAFSLLTEKKQLPCLGHDIEVWRLVGPKTLRRPAAAMRKK